MKFLTRELSKYISNDLPANDKLVDIFTSLSYEVEGVIPANNTQGVKIGKVLECEKHPNADTLSFCKVETEGQVWDVVCGGANIAAGQTVIHALPGSKVGDLELQPKELRGIVSNGMVLSVSEIGGFNKKLVEEEESDNILVLPNDIDVNEDPAIVSDFTGSVFDLSILPDRKYASNYLSMAKEFAAFTNSELLLPEDNYKSNGQTIVEIELGEKANAISTNIVKLNKSKTPKFIKNVLYQSEKKVTNTIEDIIAYVKLVTGIVVYAAPVTDRIETSERTIIANETKIDIINDSVIHSKEESVQLISYSTNFKSNVVTESNMNKFFGNTNVKGTNGEYVELALMLVNSLGQEYGYISESTTITSISKFEPRTINLDTKMLYSYIGEKVDIKPSNDILRKMGFQVTAQTYTIPEYRQDILTQQDLIEEIVRVYGIENIKPQSYEPTENKVNSEANKESYIKTVNHLSKYGFYEAKTYQLINEEDAKKYNPWNLDKFIKLREDYNVEYNTMQSSLMKGLIDTHNLNYREDKENIRFFEISNVFTKGNIPDLHVGIIHDEKIYEQDPILATKEIVIELLIELGFAPDSINFKEIKEENELFNPYQSAWVRIGSKVVGYIGEIHPKILREYKYIRVDKVKAKLYFAEIIINENERE